MTESLRLDNLIERIAGLMPRMSGPAATELRKNLRAMLTNAPLTRDYQAQWLYRGPKGAVR